MIPFITYLYEQCPACVCCCRGAQAVVAHCGEKDGHGGEFGTRDPFLISDGEGKNDKEDRKDEINVRFKVVPAKVGFCLLHVEAGLEASQERGQSSKVLPRLKRVKQLMSDLEFFYSLHRSIGNHYLMEKDLIQFGKIFTLLLWKTLRVQMIMEIKAR